MKSISRICLNCQEVFLADAREVNRGNAKFCTRKCSGEFNKITKITVKQPNVTCSWCGNTFYKKNSSLSNSKSGLYFCNKLHQNLAFADPQHPVSSGPRSSLLYKRCKVCNARHKKDQDWCTKCDTTVRIELWLNGDNSVTIYNGSTKDTRKFVKQYLRDTRGDKCEVCGFDELAPDGRNIIQMDHINGDCFDNRPENLKLLCPNHHAMTSTYGSLNKGSGRAHRRKN